jgi:hypothetical protein
MRKEGGNGVKKTRLAIFAGILIIVALASIPVSNPTAFAPLFADTLSVCPDSTWQPEGAVFEIGICVPAGITSLMGYNVAVTFDSSVIRIMSVDEGPLPQAASDMRFFWWYNAGVTSDSVHVNGAVLGTTMDGPGVLFKLTFKALRHGVVKTTHICITYSELRDGVNESIGHERKCGFVAVEPTVPVERATWGAAKDRYK